MDSNKKRNHQYIDDAFSIQKSKWILDELDSTPSDFQVFTRPIVDLYSKSEIDRSLPNYPIDVMIYYLLISADDQLNLKNHVQINILLQSAI